MYGEFWAQDATALITYAANAAASAQLTPLTEPIQSTNPGGTGAQAAAVSNAVNSNASNSGLNGLLSSLQSASSAAATPAAGAAAATPLESLYNATQAFFGARFISNSINTINVTGSWFLFIGMSAIPLLSHFVAGAPFGFTMGDATPAGCGVGLRDDVGGRDVRVPAGRRWQAWARRPRSAGCRCRPVGLLALALRRSCRNHAGGNGLDRSRRRDGRPAWAAAA